MSNTWFRFKQFTIQQDRCSMKVSTDACIQGAWTPVAAHVERVLDIGTGTGLLALMLAQRQSTFHADAIELDAGAAVQAAENVSNSPFAGRIRVQQADIRSWSADRRYDLLICNPPFFSNSLRSTAAGRRLARHDDEFSREDMAEACSRLISPGGRASILLPASQQEHWEQIMGKYGLYLQQRLLIRPYAHSPANRIISICNLSGQGREDEELVIYHQPGRYTESFAALMRPYYLGL